MRLLDNLVAWIFVKIVLYWRWRIRKSGKEGHKLTLIYAPTQPPLTPRQQKAQFN